MRDSSDLRKCKENLFELQITDDAITLIHETSRGLPRTTNNLAVNALIAAYAAGNGIVDHTAARAAITEVTATP